MKISYQPTGINNFHNMPALMLVVSGEKDGGYDGDRYGENGVYRISKGQAKKIENHFCGMSDCHCSKGSVVQLNSDATEFGIPVRYCE